jgi:phosphoenolpyruvate carboxykinase (ATP)
VQSHDSSHAVSVDLGIRVGEVHRNLPSAELTARALARGEGILAANGALVVLTGAYTGRSPENRFIVDEPPTGQTVDWNATNRPCSPALFDSMLDRAQHYLQDRDVYVFDGYVGAEWTFQIPLRVISDTAWHALFAQTLFIQPALADLPQFEPGFTVMECGGLSAEPGVEAEGQAAAPKAFIGISFARRTILILGSAYAGEIKKAVFSVMNYLLPDRGVLPMHCAANMGLEGDVALFFGLSGTGKTTLSADPGRRLIGDDEHGWSEQCVFNFEGGCYAKVIDLDAASEPQIYEAIRFGSILENVVVDSQTRAIDYHSSRITQNTRATYPVNHIPGAVVPGVAGHPHHVFFLTCDAFGVLPPIAQLSPAQAEYHFLSGFTAKLGGTEVGVTQPQPTFSACFGAPFMPLSPIRYARLLGQRLHTHGAKCWLVNTGWTGGTTGTGRRMPIETTRRLISAAISGQLDEMTLEEETGFALSVPSACPGVDGTILRPRRTWPDSEAYDEQAQRLAQMFVANFEQYRNDVESEVAGAGPSHTWLSQAN